MGKKEIKTWEDLENKISDTILYSYVSTGNVSEIEHRQLILPIILDFIKEYVMNKKVKKND